MTDKADATAGEEAAVEKPKRRIQKTGEVRSNKRIVNCARCSTSKKKHRMEVKSSPARFQWYQCPNCGERVKLARPMSDELLVKGEPPRGRNGQDDSEAER